MRLIECRGTELNGQIILGRRDRDFSERIEPVPYFLDEAHEDVGVGLGLLRFRQELNLEGGLLKIRLGGHTGKIHLHLDGRKAIDRNNLDNPRAPTATDAPLKLAYPSRLMARNKGRHAPVS